LKCDLKNNVDRTKGSNNHERLEEALPNSAPHVSVNNSAIIVLYERKKKTTEKNPFTFGTTTR